MNQQKWTSRSWGQLVPTGLLIWSAALLLVGCTAKEPIPVGFVAQLTGVQAELGVQERNGVQLAVEEFNAAGGIAGRQIQLIVKDDLGTPEGAQKVDRELIDAGVVAIIGHATSGQTLAGMTVTNPAHVVMLSPTTSTPKLSGLDDYFFRIVQTMAAQAYQSAQYLYKIRNIHRIAAIYDTDNAAYSTAYLQAFTDNFQALGGKVVAVMNFSSKSQPDFAPLVEQLRASSPDELLIVAADIDTALIAQRTRLMGWAIPLYASSWAQTETLINNGGQAVEGLEIELISAVSGQTPEYLDFKKQYQTRFGVTSSFGAILSYEAAGVLAVALEKTGGKADGLPKALAGIKDFKGLSDTFSLDKYGDAVRPIHLGVIRDRKYVGVDPLKPTAP
jgi:branched-chain amino acid transport system substrate-binding protein